MIVVGVGDANFQSARGCDKNGVGGGVRFDGAENSAKKREQDDVHCGSFGDSGSDLWFDFGSQFEKDRNQRVVMKKESQLCGCEGRVNRLSLSCFFYFIFIFCICPKNRFREMGGNVPILIFFPYLGSETRSLSCLFWVCNEPHPLSSSATSGTRIFF